MLAPRQAAQGTLVSGILMGGAFLFNSFAALMLSAVAAVLWLSTAPRRPLRQALLHAAAFLVPVALALGLARSARLPRWRSGGDRLGRQSAGLHPHSRPRSRMSFRADDRRGRRGISIAIARRDGRRLAGAMLVVIAVSLASYFWSMSSTINTHLCRLAGRPP
ncbi:MAG: hypothetical protein R2708_24020 [Vicinamibacterales bacterium]